MSAPAEYLIERLRDAAADAAAEEYGVAGLLTEAADALEAAREDAERYRWLRGIGAGHAAFFLSNSDDMIDAAIDKARGKGGRE